MRTANPFCRICGKDQLWANYDRHHVEGRAHSPDQIFICRDCHEEIHAMLREYAPVPASIPGNRHRLIHMARGQMAICQLGLKKWNEIEQWLLGEINLPDGHAETDNNDGRGSPPPTALAPEQAVHRPDTMALLEAKFGNLDLEGVQ